MVSTGYAGIALLMFVENVFPPIPSEVIMPLAGYLASQGKLSLLGVILAGTFGSVLGALPLYALGARIGEDRMKRFAAGHGRWLTLSPSDLDRTNAWFERHGHAAVFLCRLVPGVRSLISIPAGIRRMPLATFLLYTALGSAVWTSVLAGIGSALGANFDQVDRYLDPVGYAVFAGIAVGYVYRLARHRKER
ncbi:MAG: DedA family protein [Deltaproteobacteria bacterium]|nr:DedA family protein [Deltaproteobacteria bacterium]